MKKRYNIIFLAALAALMGLLMIPAGVFADSAPVKYLDENGTECTAENYISAADWPKDEPYPVLGGGWYVLDKDVTYSQYRLTILGETHLILKDGCTLNAAHGIRMAANRPEGARLTVYAQSTDKDTMGKLISNASGEESCAGIGGNSEETGGIIVINGGRIEATGGEYAAGIGGGEDRDSGNIRINGGFVTATGGEYGAGIGGGEGGSGGDITIADGTVIAKGGSKAAGIGGGQRWKGGGNGGTIVIGRAEGTTTLDLTATAGNEGAGIGGGEDGEGGSITINSGKVTASGNSNGRGAGIGGGVDAHAGTITINGGDVTALGGVAKHSDYTFAGGGAGIGAGYDNDSGSKSKTAGGHIIINGGKVKAVSGYAALDNGGAYSGGAGIGSGEDGYGCRIEIHGGNIDAMSPGLSGASIGGGYKGAGGVISIDNKTGDPTIHATTSRGNRGSDSNHAIGDGGQYSGDPAEVTFDYPNGKVWIEWYFWGGHDDGELIVAAGNRASTVAAGNGSHREIRITPCDHPGKTIKEADGGHKTICKYCSEFDGKVFPHNIAGGWKYDDQSHWNVCKDCGARANVAEHIAQETGTCECGFSFNFKLNKNELTLTEGETNSDLQVTSKSPIPDDQIQWSSSDEEVAEVTGSGKKAEVRAVKTGTAQITATAGDNLTAVCNVTVNHVHELTKVGVDREPTCTTDGERAYYRCDSDTYTYGCDKTFFDAEGTDEFSIKDIDTHALYPPALGHSWTEWNVDQEPTQSREGSMNRECETCHEPQTITTVKASAAAIDEAVSKADHAKTGVSPSKDGYDIDPAEKWAPESAFAALEAAKVKAEGIKADMDATQEQLNIAAEELAAAVLEFAGTVKNGTMGPSVSEVDKAIRTATSEEGPAGTKYAPLKLRSTKQSKKSITLTWDKTSRASRYVIYGNIAGKSNKMKKVAAVSGSVKSKAIKKAGKKLKKGKYYKFIIIGIDKNDRVVSMSKVAHVATKGGKVGNYKSVTVKKTVVTKAGKLKAGSKLSLGAKAVKASKKLKVKKRRALKYESSDTAVAAVSSKGVITAKAAGTCYVYAYAQNGVSKKIKVTVR